MLNSNSTTRNDETERFLTQCALGDYKRNNLAGDASFRRYERIAVEGRTYVMMDAPPPHEDVKPFMHIARHLKSQGFSAPEILHSDEAQGFLLLEDLGDNLFSRILSADSTQEETLYRHAIDTLVKLHAAPPPSLPVYSDELLLKEVLLLAEWYIPMILGRELSPQEREEYISIWEALFPSVQLGEDVLVLRDYHADNLLWLPQRKGEQKVGLLDFQDAVSGPVTYDLVSLLEDARRDVGVDIAHEMINYYLSSAGQDVDKEHFMTSYAILGAQRNCKILGIFARLAQRDSKPHYLEFMPRVWGYLERDITHPALSALKNWLQLIPMNMRNNAPANKESYVDSA